MLMKGQRGFTTIELLTTIAIVALIVPAIGIGIQQTMSIPGGVEANLTTSHDVSYATECIMEDANTAQSFLEGSEPDYGVFTCTDTDGNVYEVRYSFDPVNQTLVRTQSTNGDSPNTKIVATGILTYNDVSFVQGDAGLTITIRAEQNGDGRPVVSERTFHAALRTGQTPTLDWRYRCPITVTNSGGMLTDYQVLIALDTTNFDYSHANVDGSDLRFPIEYPLYELPLYMSSSYVDLTDYPIKIEITDATILGHLAQGNLDGRDLRFYTNQTATPYGSDGLNEETSSLPYWIESATTSKVTVWVRVPFISANGTTIYAYYGNPFAYPKSDISAAFDFLDNFDDGDISDWTVVDGTWDVNNNYLHSGSRPGVIIQSTFTGQVGQAFIAKVNCMSSSYNANQGIVFGYQDSNNYYYANIYSGDDIRLTKQVGGQTTTIGNVPYNHATNTWYGLRVHWISADHVIVILEDLDGNDLVRLDQTTGLEAWTSGRLGSREYREGGMDDLWARKYASSDPTVTIGTETSVNLTTLAFLPYWIENWDTAGQSKVWVKYPRVPSGDTTTNMYYGNPNAPGVSSIDDILTTGSFSDDFSDSSYIDAIDSSNVGVESGQLNLQTTTFTTIYDFSTGANVDKWAWRSPRWRYDDQLVPGTETALTTGECFNIAYHDYDGDGEDDDYDQAGDNNDRKYHRFKFTVAESVADITQMKVFWTADDESWTGSAELRIWNFTTGSWTLLDKSSWLHIGGNRETYTGTLDVPAPADYIDSNGFVYVAGSCDNFLISRYLRTYYVKLEVSYTSYPTSGNVKSVVIPTDTSTRFMQGIASSSTDSEPAGTDIKYHIEYSDDGGTVWHLIPDSYLPGNAAGHETIPDISGLGSDFPQVRLTADLTTADNQITPSIDDWAISYYYRQYTSSEPVTTFGPEQDPMAGQ